MSQTQTDITLYNTLGRSKQRFAPIDPGNVRMYVCGPTVYDRAHIGNARPVVVFDVLFRLLRHVYGAEHVTYVRNVTDVDDKINARAAAEKRPIRELTDETLAAYHADMDALGALRPTHEPRATEFIPPMISMVETLIARGHAYEAQGHVLFSVASWPAYGRFANRSLDEMQAGARVEVAPYKRDPMDFVLWKPSTAADPGWPSPWGHGRPGWHLECSAMSHALLGASFDIHGGGIDLVFPHHQNEIAQSLCSHPEGDFARYWLHNGFLNVEGEKMSKSLGNFFTVKELQEKFHPRVIRYSLLSVHYRKPLDWKFSEVARLRNELSEWANWVGNWDDTPAPSPSVALIAALSDDLNTPGAVAVLRRLYTERNYEQLRSDLLFLGLRERERSDELASVYVGSGQMTLAVSERISLILQQIDRERASRNFAGADRLRHMLNAAGVGVANTAVGSTFSLTGDFDASKLAKIK